MLPGPPDGLSTNDIYIVHHLLAITVNHRSVPVTAREQLASHTIDWHEQIRRNVPDALEWGLLSTCHRFELYMVVTDPVSAGEQVCSYLAEVIGDQAVDTLTLHVDDAVERHLCRVAAGVDSAVLGEPQILGQVTRCYADGLHQQNIGPVLSALFRAAMRAGKRARTETCISAQSVNLSSVALHHAGNWVGDLKKAHVLVIGAGEMSRLALKALYARGVQNVVVANRTLARAQGALLDDRWMAVGLDGLDAQVAQADIVFSATRADGFTIDLQTLQRAQCIRAANGDTRRGPAFIDLALPRDIDPTVRTLSSALLIDVDELHESLDRTRAQRATALPRVEALIEEEIAQYLAELREMAVRPVVVELRKQAEMIRSQEVERTLRYLGTVDEGTLAQIHHLTRSLVNKLLHAPTVRLKQMARTEDATQVADTVRNLFGLDDSIARPELLLPAEQAEESGRLRRGVSSGA